MAYVFYIGDHGPVSASVFEADGVTPITPLSATATIVNQHTGEVIIEDAGCLVDVGTMTYIIPEGSPITATSARYVAYLTAQVDATTRRTLSIPVDVLDKGSYLVVDRWRRKVEFAAPNEDALSDQEGRDWVDQAVSHLNKNYFNTGYVSTLATLTPNAGVAPAGPNEIEMIASTAALMARTAWWAGKGNWRDEEMSLDTSPFRLEWEGLKSIFAVAGSAGWYSGYNDPNEVNSMYNRDKIDVFGFSDEPDNYHNAEWLGDTD